jgi:hypothetical protein
MHSKYRFYTAVAVGLLFLVSLSVWMDAWMLRLIPKEQEVTQGPEATLINRGRTKGENSSQKKHDVETSSTSHETSGRTTYDDAVHLSRKENILWITPQSNIIIININNNTSTAVVSLDRSFSTNEDTFCCSWDIDIDDWWTHHVTWKLGKETRKGYCLKRISPKSKRAEIYQDLYQNQFPSSCNGTLTKRMWSTGWGADFINIIDGLEYGLQNHQPLAMAYPEPWHYAKTPNCASPTLDCYFLPLGNCSANPSKYYAEPFFIGPVLLRNRRFWYDFLTRPKTWMRRRVVDFVQDYLPKLPKNNCTVMHVRRGDVVLHRKDARRYFSISEYMTAAKDVVTQTILLLTDDANALAEANALYPNHTWVTIQRTRFQAAQGGWENHFPSGDPLYEATVLLSLFRLAQECEVLVHTDSNMADILWGVFRDTHGMNKAKRIYLKPAGKTFDQNNTETVVISKSNWTTA